MIEYADAGLSSTNPSNSYNFGTRNLATVAPKRTLVLMISSINANLSGVGNVTSVSLAGQAMTNRATLQAGTGARTVWTLEESASATGNLTINRNISTGFSSAYWILWAIYNLKDVVPVDAQFANTGNPSSGVTIGVEAGGAVVAFASSANSGANVSWTGVASDVVLAGGVGSGDRIYGGSALTPTTGSLAVTAARAALVQAWAASFR
ncbi:MAG: hypothetical protein WC807_18425 [Hyphomicrobium sp.]|jgi:hypothetical protein